MFWLLGTVAFCWYLFLPSRAAMPQHFLTHHLDLSSPLVLSTDPRLIRPLGVSIPIADNVWQEVIAFLVEHPTSWGPADHFGWCGQSCGCCRSHVSEAGMNCQACWLGWMLTTICSDIRARLKQYMQIWVRTTGTRPRQFRARRFT